jgi:hypothetical protein
MKVLFVGADTVAEHNCEEWRCAIPFRALRRAGVPCEYIHLDTWIQVLDDEFTKQADLVIFQRNIFSEAVNKINYWKTKGKAIVLDLDDAYALMTADTGSPSSDFWILGKQVVDGKTQYLKPLPIDILRLGVKMIGAVSSPSELILEDWKPYGVQTYFLPNYLEMGIYKVHDVYKQPGKIYIGGGGSMGHVKSWLDSGIHEAMIKVCSEDKRVIIAFAGDERNLSKFRVPLSQRVNLHWVPFSLYPRSLAIFDIGVVPLAGEYDRRRSWIKPAEYSVMGIPWIGTNYEPNRYVKGGRLVENTKEDWYTAIKSYIERLPDVQVKAHDEIPDRVHDFSIDENIDKLLATYEQIIKETK